MKLDNLFLGLAVADIARRHPLTYVDIGCRGGFQSDLLPIAFAVNAVGFEPDPDELARLHRQHAGPWLSSRFLPYAIAGTTRRQKLFVPADAQSASLMRHDAEIGHRFKKPQFFDVQKTVDIDALSLGDAVRVAGSTTPDYLKIDIEGAELEVFEASPEVMNGVLAVKTEVSFLVHRHGQPLSYHVEAYFKGHGFDLMDILQPAHWRREGYLLHPYMAPENPPYSRGQIVHADHLYFRNPDALGSDAGPLIKLALISMAFGYFDNALMILERPDLQQHLHRLGGGASPAEIVRPAARKYGRRMFAHAAWQQLRGGVPFIRYFRNFLAG